MRFLDARLIFAVLLAWVLGTVLQLQQAHLWDGLTYGLAAGAGLLALVFLALRTGAWWVQALAGTVAVAVLAFSATGLRSQLYLQDALPPALEGQDLLVTGIVASMTQRSEAGLRFRLDVEAVSLGGKPVQLPRRLYLSWYAGPLGFTGAAMPGLDLQASPADLAAGERWQLVVRLKAPHGGSNPHGFDYELWLWEQGLQATGYVRAGPRDAPARRLAQTWQHPVEQARQRVRDAVFERLPDRKLAGLIAALVVGDQAAIDRADWDVFRATGVAHLMSISGLHITMFAWLAALAVGGLWRRSTRLCLALPAPHAALLGGVFLAAAYALFSGWGVPAQRTILMLASVGVLRWLGKKWPWPLVWMLACAVVVLADPWALLQAGFWLSFVAVGLLFATDPGRSASEADQPQATPLASSHQLVRRAWQHLRVMWREQRVITAALAPLTLLLFGQVSLVGLLANLLAVPWVTLVVTPLAMAGALVPAVWDAAAFSIQGMTQVLQWFAAWPLATISVPQAPLWAGVAGVLGGALLVFPSPWHLRLLGLPLLIPVVFWQTPTPAPGHFELLVADIGQGNAVLVRTAQHALVYDSGPRFSRESDAGQRVVVPLLRAMDVRVDTLVLSHRDADHTGGAAAILAMQPGATLLSSIEDAHELQSVRAATRCAAGQRWTWDGVAFEFLHPAREDYLALVKSNGMSCVLRVSNGRQTALLTGDIELPQETRLVADAGSRAKLKADVLLVPHHGSKTSSSAPFLEAVAPQIAFVQNGYRNRFGHPAALVTERYRERGIRLYTSPRCGAATWQSSAPEQVVCEREKRLRYWHHRVP